MSTMLDLTKLDPVPPTGPRRSLVPSMIERHQAGIAAKKNPAILESMLAAEKLAKLYKCSGRYCVFATDDSELAERHWMEHSQIGSTDTFDCVYCDQDIWHVSDLVWHIFGAHGRLQYSCSKCFYRAICANSVESHLRRIHKVQPVAGESVLETFQHLFDFEEFYDNSQQCLSVLEAVPMYKCAQRTEGEGSQLTCVFHSMYREEFVTHMAIYHRGATMYRCSECNVVAPDATKLVGHLRRHERKSYQCSLCVYGADCKLEVVAHFSCEHPDKYPKAYSRLVVPVSLIHITKCFPLVFIKDMTQTPGETLQDAVIEARAAQELEAISKSLTADPKDHALAMQQLE